MRCKVYTWVLALLLAPALQAQNAPKFPAATPTHADLLIAANAPRTALNGGMSDATLSVLVTDGSGFVAPGASEATAIKVDDEIMKICARSGNTFTVCSAGRGWDGSTAVAHSSGALVIGVANAWYHNQVAAEVKAITEALGAGFGKSGDTATMATTSGALVSGNCVQIDASGNLIDSGGACGGGSVAVQENDVTVTATASTFDFLGADFDVTDSPAGEANIVIAAAIARDSELHAQAHAIDGADHTAAGLTAGNVMRATAATTFAFGALLDADIPDAHTLASLSNITTRDHDLLAGLTDDDHTQYALLLGRAAGQTIIGGTGVGDDLTLQTTSNASKGSYIFPDLADGVLKSATGVVTGGLVADADLANNYAGVGACAANQWASTLNDNAAPTCTQPAFTDISGAATDAQVPDTITASNYLPLAGGTLTGQLVSDNLGVEFGESDTNPACAAGNYSIFADLSETTLKKCLNGVVSVLDTGGGSSLPVVDTTSIAEGSVDATKEARIEVDTFVPTATVVVLTVPAVDITLSGINIAQTWAAAQTFSAAPILTTLTSALVHVNGSGQTEEATMGSGVTLTAGTLAVDGAVVGLLGGTNTWSAMNNFSGGLRVRGYVGTPTAGDCTSSTIGAKAINTNNGGETYTCLQTGAATYTWLDQTSLGQTIDLASEVTGVAPIANGGTGQATQTPAFDALAPTTTKGDITVHNGTDNIRVAVGTNNQVLTADSAQASGVKWAVGGSATSVHYKDWLFGKSDQVQGVTNPLVSHTPTSQTSGTAGTWRRAFASLDGTAAEWMNLEWTLPDEWTGNLDFLWQWGYTATATAGDKVRFTFEFGCFGVGEQFDGTPTSIVDKSVSKTVASTTFRGINKDTHLAVDISATCSAGERLILRFGRDPTHVDDNRVDDVTVSGLTMKYETTP